MDYKKEWEQIVRDFNNMFVSNPISLEKLQAKFMEWQESLWFEAELEAEHAAEQQAAAKKSEYALGTTCSGSTSSTFASTILKAEQGVESSEEQVQEHQDKYWNAFPIKVGDVVLFRNHRRGEWEEGIIKGRIECWGAGEELYTVSTSSEDYIVNKFCDRDSSCA